MIKQGKAVDVINMIRLMRKDKQVILTTVSGIVTTTVSMLRWADTHLGALSMLTTKSFQVKPNPGNREPVIVEAYPGCYGNSVGLRNEGMVAAEAELKKLHPLRCMLNVSLSASNPEDFVLLARRLAPFADLLELNFSCPHAAEGFGSFIGGDSHTASHYMKHIRTKLGSDFPVPIFVKLIPVLETIGEIADAVISAGADGITAVNASGPDLYIEPHSGMPVLNNHLGGRGGKSGRCIRELALESVAQVRKSVGKDIPIIGMGGVSTGIDAYNMIQCGADIVGIGSSFGTVSQQNWPAYLDAIQREGTELLQNSSESIKPSSSSYLTSKPTMKYIPYRVVSNTYQGSEIRVIDLDGEVSTKPGEYFFIWIPGIGEKPYTAAKGSPLKFVAKNRGFFSSHLCAVKPGDTVYLRGPYGRETDTTAKQNCLLIAGGTGIAVLPDLCRTLKTKRANMKIFYGTSGISSVCPLQNDLRPYGQITTVCDEGVPGRVIEEAHKFILESDPASWACYVIGPEDFMDRTASCMLESGVADDEIYLSLERTSLCGVGMCGTCSCGGRLTCQYGTFVRYDYLRSNEPERYL